MSGFLQRYFSIISIATIAFLLLAFFSLNHLFDRYKSRGERSSSYQLSPLYAGKKNYGTNDEFHYFKNVHDHIIIEYPAKLEVNSSYFVNITVHKLISGPLFQIPTPENWVEPEKDFYDEENITENYKITIESDLEIESDSELVFKKWIEPTSILISSSTLGNKNLVISIYDGDSNGVIAKTIIPIEVVQEFGLSKREETLFYSVTGLFFLFLTIGILAPIIVNIVSSKNKNN